MRVVASGIEAALRGNGRLLLFFGEPGIGKTRLAEEAAHAAARRGATILWGRCGEGDGAPAFWPWVQVARSYEESVRSVTVDDDHCKHAGGHGPELGWPVQFLSAPMTAGDLRAEEARFRIFDDFSLFLKKAATAQPLVIILDDLHWADTPSLLFLEFLTCEIRQSRIVIVGTYRDVDHGPEHPMPNALGALTRHRLSQGMRLARFSMQQTAQFLVDFEGGSPSRAWAAAVHEKTDGNPLFVSEFAGLLMSEAELRNPHLQSSDIHLPRTLRQVIMHRLSHLSPATNRALAVAAVIGREFDAKILAPVDRLSITAALSSLDEARAAGIIEEAVGRLGHYRFTHGLIREALYEDLRGTMRVDVHSKVASALEEFCAGAIDGQEAQLAYHYCQAVPKAGWRKAVEYSLLAGKQAASAVAYEEAIRHYGRALHALAGGRANLPARCEIQLGLGDFQAKSGDWSAARQTFHEAARLARQLGDVEQFAKGAIGFKGVLASTEPVDSESVALLEEAISLLDGSRTLLFVRAVGALALSVYYARSASERIDLAEKAVQVARDIGDPAALCVALEARFFGQWRPEGTRDGLVTLDNIIQLAKTTGDRDITFRSRVFRYMCLSEVGEVLRSEREWVRCVQLAEEVGHPRHKWQVSVIAAGRALLRGDIPGATAMCHRARQLGSRVHDATAEQYYLLQRFYGLRLSGNVEDLYAVFPKVSARSFDIPAYQVALGSICCSCGRLDEGRQILESLCEMGFDRLLDDGFGLFCVSLVAEMISLLGDQAKAKDAYEALLPYADRNIVASWGAACDGSVSHYLGGLAGTLARWDIASRHFEYAVAMNRRLGAPPLVARSEQYYGLALWMRNGPGDRGRAQELVNGAISVYRRLDMRGYLQQALALTKQWESECFIVGQCSHAEVRAPTSVGLAGVATSIPVCEGARGCLINETGKHGQDTEEDVALSQHCVFRREGEYWTLIFRGVVSRLRGTMGLEYLAYLVSRPHQEIAAIDLVSVVGRRGSSGYAGHVSDARLADDQLRAVGLGDAGPIIDRKARDAYRERMKDLRLQAEEADEMNDVGKASALRREIERIREEVAAGCGLGGRSRAAASAFERARVSVRNSMTTALRTIGIHDRALWRHLTNSVRTGALCCYDPEEDVPWIVSL